MIVAEQWHHDIDVKALLRMSVRDSISTVCNRSTADFIVSSILCHGAYTPIIKNHSQYIQRKTLWPNS